jgi:[acyl-carrier-protein] S-malonyltransferase
VIAFIFPGQGSQKVGMGKALAAAFPVCRDTFDEADEALGQRISQLCFEGPEDRLLLTENAQPAILAVSTAVTRLLGSRGVTPEWVAGHSLGEYSAHVAAGTISFPDALRIVRQRGRYMQEAVAVGEGAMAAILGLGAELVEQACRDAAEGEVVSPANFNAPDQVVIAGTRDAVARAGTRAKALGARKVIPLALSAPFHCALMTPAADRLAPHLRALAAKDPRVPVVADVDGKPRRDAASAIQALIEQIVSPVRWETVVGRLASEGVRTYVEAGPGAVLSGLVRKIVRGATVVNIEDDRGVEAIDRLGLAGA